MSDRWKKLQERLEVRGGATGANKPTDAELDAFQKAYGFELPDAYREFVKAFGPGELSAYVRIYAPASAGTPGRLAQFVDGVRDAAELLGEKYGDPAFVARMVPFANTLAGDMIAWDPDAVTDAKSHEYGTSVLQKDSSKIVRAASTFTAFIDCVLSPAFGKYVDYPDYEPQDVYVPFPAAGV